MVNPYDITNYNRTKNELQEFILFTIVVAGKTAYIQAQKLDQFLNSINTRLMMPDNISPFQSLKSAYDNGILLEEIHKAKLGQYKKIYSAFLYIIEHDINLNRTTPVELELIPGVGMKTSRFFLLHSDMNYKDNIAILDTHILKFIKENIDNRAPKSTPTNSNTYKHWEDLFLMWCDENKKDTAEFDLEIWKSYARKNKEVSESE
jgi:thermostable 8-oxoguanine DNA glycosylase